MAVTDIRLQGFRSYEDSAFELDPSVNIIVGPNTSGKTNLLEALLIIASGKSYKASPDEVIKFGSEWSRLDAHTQDDDQRTVKISRTGQITSKTFEISHKTYKTLPLAQTLPTVLFEPTHLLTLTGTPDLRRDYLDDILEQTIVGYGQLRRDYKKALRQRNRLLKNGQRSDQLFVWNVKLSQLAVQIVKARHQLAEELNRQIKSLYQKLSGSKQTVEINYRCQLSPANYGSLLLKKLEQNLELDFTRGFTGYGPHRDDLDFLIDGHNVIDSASRGEVRTIVLALKIMELGILEKQRNKSPILLLDDVFSELDGKRRKALTGYLKNYQTFITTTDADLVVHNFAQKCHIIPLTKNNN